MNTYFSTFLVFVIAVVIGYFLCFLKNVKIKKENLVFFDPPHGEFSIRPGVAGGIDVMLSKKAMTRIRNGKVLTGHLRSSECSSPEFRVRLF